MRFLVKNGYEIVSEKTGAVVGEFVDEWVFDLDVAEMRKLIATEKGMSTKETKKIERSE